jgi:hypothetical protein
MRHIPRGVAPIWVVIWNLAWMLKDASYVADHKHKREDVQARRLPDTTTPSGIISVHRSNIRLHHGDAMEEEINQVQARNGEAHESDRQKFRWLAPALILRRSRSGVHGFGGLSPDFADRVDESTNQQLFIKYRLT